MIVYEVNCHARCSFARHLASIVGDRAHVIRRRVEMGPSRSDPWCQSVQHQQLPTGRATDYHSRPDVNSQRVEIVRISIMMMQQLWIRYRAEQASFRIEDKYSVSLQYDNVTGTWRTAVHNLMKRRGLGIGLAHPNGANTVEKCRCSRRLSTSFGERLLQLENVRLDFVYQQSARSNMAENYIDMKR